MSQIPTPTSGVEATPDARTGIVPGADARSPEGEMPVDPAVRRRSRFLLLAILASFAVPLLLAILWLRVVQSGGAGELGDTSRGELIRPAVPLEAFALDDAGGEALDLDTFRGIWTMLYLPAGDCGDTCERNLYHMRQVRLALNQRMTRVQRMIVPGGESTIPTPLLAEHPGLILADGDSDARSAFAAQIAAAQTELPPIEDAIYLVDPFGNVMMRFAPDLPPESILKDVKHLLKVSKIG